MKENKDWSAWIDVMSDPTMLHVSGWVEIADLSVGAVLNFVAEERSNPATLLLALSETHLTTSRKPGSNALMAPYTQPAKEGDFKSIKITNFDGSVIHIEEIEVAHLAA